MLLNTTPQPRVKQIYDRKLLHFLNHLKMIFLVVTFMFFGFFVAGFCLRYRPVLRLLFLLHDPIGSALLVLLC